MGVHGERLSGLLHVHCTATDMLMIVSCERASHCKAPAFANRELHVGIVQSMSAKLLSAVGAQQQVSWLVIAASVTSPEAQRCSPY